MIAKLNETTLKANTYFRFRASDAVVSVYTSTCKLIQGAYTKPVEIWVYCSKMRDVLFSLFPIPWVYSSTLLKGVGSDGENSWECSRRLSTVYK